NPASGCTHTNNAAACDDDNTCTVSDTCQGGVCVGQFICDDGNPCTDDACDGAGGCLHSNNTAPCEDSNACTATETCQDGASVGPAAPTCDDGTPCTDDSSDPASARIP